MQRGRLLAEARFTAAVDALGDLRAVVRGILPPVLADRGLVGAIQALVLASPVPVEISAEIRPSGSPAPRRVGGVLRRRRGDRQRDQAQCGSNRLDTCPAPRRWSALDAGRGRRSWRRRSGQGERSAGGSNTVSRHSTARSADLESVGWADGRDHGGAVRAVIAEDLALLGTA